MYFVLGLSVVLATLLLLNCFMSLLASLTWGVFGTIARQRLSATSCAGIIFFLRTFPIVLGLIYVSFLLAPAYLEHEPRFTHEPVSLKLASIAAASAIGLGLAIFRGFGAWRATSRLKADWLRHAEPIELSHVKIPAYRIQHQFPVIAVVGVLRPRLFIAKQVFSSLRQEELVAAIEHETGHLAANDNLRRGLMRACRDVVVMAPFGRLLDRAWIESSEAAADEYAARHGRAIALDLAAALVKTARMIPAGMKPSMPAGAYFVDATEVSGVKARVGRLVQLADSRGIQRGRTLILRIPLWVPIVCLFAAVALAATDPQVLVSVHIMIEHTVHLLS